MKRKWIMIEKEDTVFSHIILRIQRVISGEDQGGISKLVEWQGGGYFTYEQLHWVEED